MLWGVLAMALACAIQIRSSAAADVARRWVVVVAQEYADDVKLPLPSSRTQSTTYVIAAASPMK